MNPIKLKVDLFMKMHIVPNFHPEKIHWVFSVSGGKDSFVMCESIKEWYITHNYSLKATAIYIWQWGEDNACEFLENTFPWIDDIQVIDARSCTSKLLINGEHQQAPCRLCSDIRHHFSDIYMKQLNTKVPIILCRGLHMTDMSISILWRLVWYGNALQLDGKGKPLVSLSDNIFLAKPLCYVREYESQMYAKQYNYTPLHINCPAYLYPSRRDIIEESIRQFYTTPLWEFDVPGMMHYLKNIVGYSDISYLKTISLCGQEVKKNIIPDEYYEFIKNYFLQAKIPRTLVCSEDLLEENVLNFLRSGECQNISEHSYSCKLLKKPQSMTRFELRMTGTLGPFWAAIALKPEQRKEYEELQKEIWGIGIDKDWNQVYTLLRLYYQSLS